MTPIDLIFDPAHDPINKPARKTLSATQVRMHTLTRATIRNFRSCESVTRWTLRPTRLLSATTAPTKNMIEILWKHAKYHWREFAT